MRCDFCLDKGNWKNILRDIDLIKADGSDIRLCDTCLSLYANHEYDKLEKRLPRNSGNVQYPKKMKIPKKYEKEIKHLQRTKIPRCIYCKKNWIKIREQSSKFHSTWKPDCKCIKKEICISIG